MPLEPEAHSPRILKRAGRYHVLITAVGHLQSWRCKDEGHLRKGLTQVLRTTAGIIARFKGIKKGTITRVMSIRRNPCASSRSDALVIESLANDARSSLVLSLWIRRPRHQLQFPNS